MSNLKTALLKAYKWMYLPEQDEHLRQEFEKDMVEIEKIIYGDK